MFALPVLILRGPAVDVRLHKQGREMGKGRAPHHFFFFLLNFNCGIVVQRFFGDVCVGVSCNPGKIVRQIFFSFGFGFGFLFVAGPGS